MRLLLSGWIRAALAGLAAAAVLAPTARAGPATGEGPVTGSAIVREVRPGDRLEVNSYIGSVTLLAWDRSEVSVMALGKEESLLVERSGSRLRVIPASWVKDEPDFEVRLPDMARVRVVGRPPGVFDLTVRAPAWVPLVIEGPFIDVSVTGFQAPVDITVAGGKVEARSTTGPVSVVDLNGAILVEDATGDLTLGGGAGAVTVRRSAGDLRVESTTGDIRLEGSRSARVEATTVGGNLSWLGPLARDGYYDLSTHDGDITLEIPGRPDAVFSIRAFRGRIETDLPRPEGHGADRLEIVTGEGRGTVRLVSFSGTIRVETE